jgi:hypothetical protein
MYERENGNLATLEFPPRTSTSIIPLLRHTDMRTEFRQLLLALTFLLSIGCQKTEPEVQSQMHQVLGALQIPNKTERDSALAAACRKSATAGDIESVLLGLPKISDTKQRDVVAEECFEILAKADNKLAAARIAELITDPTKRTQLSAVLTAQ